MNLFCIKCKKKKQTNTETLRHATILLKNGPVYFKKYNIKKWMFVICLYFYFYQKKKSQTDLRRPQVHAGSFDAKKKPTTVTSGSEPGRAFGFPSHLEVAHFNTVNKMHLWRQLHF